MAAENLGSISHESGNKLTDADLGPTGPAICLVENAQNDVGGTHIFIALWQSRAEPRKDARKGREQAAL